MTIPFGVYIGKDIEVLSTEQYVIVYRRCPDNRQLESLLMDNTLRCIGICHTTPMGIPQMILDMLDRNVLEVTIQDNKFTIAFDDEVVSNDGTPPDDLKAAFLRKKIHHLSLREPFVVIHYQDGDEYSFTPPEDINWEYALLADDIIASSDEMKGLLNQQHCNITAVNGDELQIKFTDGTIYSAKAHELFTMEDLSPHCPTPKEASVGACLQIWNVGCTETVFENRFSGVTVNTWKHMFIFEITQHSVYCRAARYIACDKGVVFDQNFRQGYEAYMIEDNRVAMNELSYDESLFNPEICVWDSKSVYWSTAKVTHTEIELHGCQGDIYHWTKPER